MCKDKFHVCASVCVQLGVYVHIICGHLPQDEISECVTESADEYYSKDSITLDSDCASSDLAIEVTTEQCTTHRSCITSKSRKAFAATY